MAYRRLALFDMDRTLVRKDTATLLTRYRRETGQAELIDTFRVGFWVLQYGLGIADAESIAKKVLKGYRGVSEAQLFADGLACFDAYVFEQHHAPPTFIKMDVEGGELDVLSHGRNSTPASSSPLCSSSRMRT